MGAKQAGTNKQTDRHHMGDLYLYPNIHVFACAWAWTSKQAFKREIRYHHLAIVLLPSLVAGIQGRLQSEDSHDIVVGSVVSSPSRLPVSSRRPSTFGRRQNGTLDVIIGVVVVI